MGVKREIFSYLIGAVYAIATHEIMLETLFYSSEAFKFHYDSNELL